MLPDCLNCKLPTLREITLPTYSCHAESDGQIREIIVNNLPVLQCGVCGEFVFNYTSNEIILTAVRQRKKEKQL